MVLVKFFKAMKQKDEGLAREIELFKHRLEVLEQLAKGRLPRYFHFMQTYSPVAVKVEPT